MRRPDTAFRAPRIARDSLCALAALLCGLAAVDSACAQALGERAPGTPGAFEEELRARNPRPRAEAPASRLRGATPPAATQGAQKKFGLQRNGNGAVRRDIGSGQERPGAPGGPGGPPSLAPPLRGPEVVTGLRPPLPPPGVAPPVSMPPRQVAAPGLAPPPDTQRRRATAEADPYAPLGIRSGGMIFRPAIEVSGGVDSNPSRSPGAHKSSPLYRTEGTLAATSDWSSHQLDINLRGAFTGYTALSAANRPEGDARIALRLDATRDLSFETGLTARVDTESATSVNLPGGATGRTPYYNYGGYLGATQRFGYASLNLRGTLDRFSYSDVTTGTGTTSQTARNYTSYGLRLRGGYELSPGITPFVEAGIDRRTHDLKTDTAGYARDSNGLVARLGSTFELARTLTGEVSAGYTIRAYEDARLATMKAPLLAASLAWSISPLTTLSVRAESDIAETTVAGSSGARSYRAQAALTHAFLRNFTATASLGVTRADYDKTGRQEDGLTGGLALEYKFSRALGVKGSYTFERLHVNTPGENYTAHTFMLGMKYTP